MSNKRTVEIVRINGTERQEAADQIITEQLLNIYVNKELYASLMCTPAEKIELAIGFLYADGVIVSYESVKSAVELTEDIVCVMLDHELDEESRDNKVFTSGCAKGSVSFKANELKDLKRIVGNCKYPANEILTMIKELNHKSELFKDTGGVHSCAICGSDGILLFSEDIGRHNALDKVIGKALINKIDLGDKLLMTTGRISSDMALKAARAGLPIIVSHSAPTDMALDISKKANITVVGFARGNRMNVYSYYDRIIV